MNKTGLIIFILCLIVLTFLGVFALLKEKQSDEPPLHTSDILYGFLIKQNNSLYFVDKATLKDGKFENYTANSSTRQMGHPADYFLIGEIVEAQYNEFETGDEVKIWSSMILESFPAQIVVQKIEIIK
jgi:hypothetical protein